ncbi:Protein NRT1/ PTR FAMILY 4.5, partial [Cucurbita argyrosperma subsp. argyrosperma]
MCGLGAKNGDKKGPKRGGNRAAVTEGLENMAFVALALSLMTYFNGYMNFSLTKSATTLTNFMGTTFLLTLVGGFVSDTECKAANGGQEAILYVGIYLIALGASGVKVALPALGADQFEEGDPAEAGKLSSFFNWFLFSLTTGSTVGLTLIVWINTEVGWDWAFVVCTTAVLAAILVVCAGKSFFRNNVPKGSPILRILQVIVASIRNRKLPLPNNADELHEIRGKEADIPIEILEKTDQFSLTMDCNFIGFKIPGPSIPVIPLLFMFFFIPFYERVFVPLARKITGIPTGIRHLQRIGFGLILTAASMAIAGFVETDARTSRFNTTWWIFCVFGMADIFTMVGLLEFFYAESSAEMKSLSTAIAWCSIAFGYFTSTVVVEVVNKASGGWLASNNLNRDNLNYFYWLLSVLSVVNFGFYLVCASWYRYKNVEVLQKQGEEGFDIVQGP